MSNELHWTVRIDINGQQFEQASTDYGDTINMMARHHGVESYTRVRPVPLPFIEKATGETFSGEPVTFTVFARHVTTTRLWCFGVLVSLAAVFVGLSLTFASRAVAGADSAMPGCCYSPRNQYDLRCAGARFGWAPGTNTDDPGTWGPRYNPWDGDCQNYSGSAFHTAGWHRDPPPPVPVNPPMCLQIDPIPFPHMAYAPCGWTKERDGHWHAPGY